MLKKLVISGFRGFGKTQTIEFSLPKGKRFGSGLTVITGANNSGKTTIIESIRAFNGEDSPSFSEGRRNIKARQFVKIDLVDENDVEHRIATVNQGGSSTTRTPQKERVLSYIVPSRRSVSFEFSKNGWDRESFIRHAQNLKYNRESILNSYEARIFQIFDNKPVFDKIVAKILGKDFDWTIDQRDNGSYYIKYQHGGASHSAEGIGDGVWSVFTICAAFCDAKQGDVIVIDEPELSVHPALQKRLMDLFLEKSAEYQIILSTHSPYMIRWSALFNGGKLIRVVKEGEDSVCYSLKDETIAHFKGVAKNINNPHVLGIEASEVFFCEDGVILVEGQEDVVIYQKIADELGVTLSGSFFGWGAGGAEHMTAILMMFRDLGYRAVVAVLDGDKQDLANVLRQEFSQYGVEVLKTEDIRDKKEQQAKRQKFGVSDSSGHIKGEYQEYMKEFLIQINDDLNKHR